MIRDLKALMVVETVYERHGGRGRGRLAVHFVRTDEPATPDGPVPRGPCGT